MDSIYKSAKAFERLLNINYKIIVGKNNKSVVINLKFKGSEFYHLCELHKISDIEQFNSPNSKKAFHYLLDGTVTDELCCKSRYYSEI